jgi:hypothetical protein
MLSLQLLKTKIMGEYLIDISFFEQILIDISMLSGADLGLRPLRPRS